MGTLEEREISHMLGSRVHTTQVYPGANAIQKVSWNPRFYLTVLKEPTLRHSGVRAKYAVSVFCWTLVCSKERPSPMPEAWARGLHWQSPEVSLPEISLYKPHSQRTSTLNCAESNNSRMEPEMVTIFCTTQGFCMTTKLQQIINTKGAFSLELDSSNLYTLAPSWPKERKLLDSRAPGNGKVARERRQS